MGKHHPVVNMGFAKKSGLVFPASAKDQKWFLNLLPHITVDDVSFKATKASWAPKNRVILDIRIPNFGSQTPPETWMRTLPLANGQQQVGS